MTREDILGRIEQIKSRSGDDEVAHSMEDQLMRDVLYAIRDGAQDAMGLAAAACEVSKLTFRRWST